MLAHGVHIVVSGGHALTQTLLGGEKLCELFGVVFDVAVELLSGSHDGRMVRVEEACGKTRCD